MNNFYIRNTVCFNRPFKCVADSKNFINFFKRFFDEKSLEGIKRQTIAL